MKPLLTLSLALLAGTATPMAIAHAHLTSKQASAQALTLVFSEGVEATFSSVNIINAQGQAVPLQPITTQPGDNTVLLATPSSPLPPGEYDAAWQVVSVDTHKSSGTLHFKIGR